MERLDLRHSGPYWALASIIFLASSAPPLPPPSPGEPLLCLFCPLQPKSQSCTNVTTQCAPGKRCASSTGRYGAFHALSSQDCVDQELCGSHQLLPYRGLKFNVSHVCCCTDRCNRPPEAQSGLKSLLGIKTHERLSDVPREEAWDSCANYTSPEKSKVSETASKGGTETVR